MKKSFYVLFVFMTILLTVMSSCGKSAKEKAAIKAKEDSTRIADSTRRADSLFAAQTQDMLDADEYMERHLDSIRRVDALTRMHSQQMKMAFLKKVMTRYFDTLNKGGNVSTAMGGDVSNQVLQALTATNGGPSTAARDTTGKLATYTLLGVSSADEQGWFLCAWKKGNQRKMMHIKVALNVRKLRLEEAK